MNGVGGFDMRVEATGDGTLVKVSGEIDILSGAEFVSTLRQAVLAADTRLDIDLSEVTYFGSEGVQGLVIAERLARDGGVELSMEGSAVVTRALEVTGLTEIFER